MILNLTMMMRRSVSDFGHNLLLSLIVFLSFLSFKLYSINGREFYLLSFKHNAQLRYLETRPSCQFSFITSCSLLLPAQILEETHPRVHGSPFLAHDPDILGTFSVPPGPAGKVPTSLFLIGFFEEFAAPILRFTQVHCGQKWFHSWLNELTSSGSVTCGILISTLLSLQLV